MCRLPNQSSEIFLLGMLEANLIPRDKNEVDKRHVFHCKMVSLVQELIVAFEPSFLTIRSFVSTTMWKYDGPDPN